MRLTRAPLTAAQQVLATQYLPLARAMAKALVRRLAGMSDDAMNDVMSAAYLGLVEAAQSFDAARGFQFSTFARHRIRGALRDWQRSLVHSGWEHDPRGAPVVVTMPPNPEEVGRVVGATADPPIGQDVDRLDQVESCLRRLPRAEAEVCRRIYVDGRLQREVAGQLGISRAWASRLKMQGVERLRRATA